MKTIADFKRKIVLGAKVHTIYHQQSNGRDENGKIILIDKELGEREISIVQTNSFALKTIKSDGKVTDSWCNYPTKKEIKFIDDSTVQILSEDFRDPLKQLIPCLTYKFLS